MPITYFPRAGQILLCDFSQGFREPEMVKSSRPVIVLSGTLAGRANLVSVVACSTVEPDPMRNYHYLLPAKSMPKTKHFRDRNTWVKGDMVYTVAFHRLDAICIGKDRCGKRIYHTDQLGKEQMNEIYKCVLSGLGMSFLNQHIG